MNSHQPEGNKRSKKGQATDTGIEISDRNQKEKGKADRQDIKDGAVLGKINDDTSK